MSAPGPRIEWNPFFASQVFACPPVSARVPCLRSSGRKNRSYDFNVTSFLTWTANQTSLVGWRRHSSVRSYNHASTSRWEPNSWWAWYWLMTLKNTHFLIKVSVTTTQLMSGQSIFRCNQFGAQHLSSDYYPETLRLNQSHHESYVAEYRTVPWPPDFITWWRWWGWC